MKGKISGQEIVDILRNEPTPENWVRFETWLAKSKSKYYRIYYREGNISSEQDLLGSYATIFDQKGREVARIPIYEKLPDGGVKGSLFHLRGLERMV
ncbi:MAG: hypothetical protein M1267_04105 [Candidatus Thermoplasmatota archaeon]|jgi:hypothetical protein|nr:hypothetical protein [Candidatus Thermoplasmatota archaeon]MCL5800742.1 hypothetical protein [Candidatus Thermoplasmatota archaeon]